MSTVETILIAIGLAMDAFAVAICKGLAMKKITFTKMVKVGIWFGVFQAVMPIIGFYLANTFAHFMQAASNWIAFILLAWIGANMIREAMKKEEESLNEDLSFKVMLPLAVATSIDALTVGVSFSFLNVNIGTAAFFIGVITFVLSMIGVKIGNQFGNQYEKKAQVAGGIILIILGIKSLFG